MNNIFSSSSIIIVAFLIISLVSIIFYQKYKKKIHLFFYILFIIYGLAVISVTLLPIGDFGIKSLSIMHNYMNVIPFAGADGFLTYKDMVQCVQNGIMFMPLGILIPLTFGKKLTIKEFMTFCFMTSLTIEMIQLFGTTLGFMWRAFDVNDLIFNTLGGTLTYSFVYLIAKCLYIQKEQAQSLS